MKCNKCGYDWSNSGDSAHVCGPVKVKQQEQGEPFVHGGRPMTLRECMEVEEPQQEHSFTYEQMKEQVEGLQRDYDLLLAEYNLLKQEQGEPVAWCRYEDGMWVYYETKAWDDLQPLYTTPQQRKPLEPTVPEDANINQRISFKAGWKAAEAAHGIKE